MNWLAVFLTIALPLLAAITGSPIINNNLDSDLPYQDEPEFKDLLDETLKRLEEQGADENAHGRILAVNEVHKRYQSEAQGANTISSAEIALETNLEHNVSLFEGDIVLDEYDDALGQSVSEQQKRGNAVRSRRRLWKTRMIPYYISPTLSHIRSEIQKALRRIMSVSCLRFYEVGGLLSNTNLIRYKKERGCSSRIGIINYKKSYQTVSLGDGCQFYGTIIHETMHALGFWHEQSRKDRDKHVKILWQNIVKGYEICELS